jgi:acyl-CoA synthetase (AMP-forming)/AMP-acid ligase II
LPGFELRIVGATGGQVAGSTVGRVQVRGPSLMEGYLGRPQATAAVLADGWLDTGDLGFLHGGELFLTGRAKDLLILRGRNHAPEEVEQAVDGVAGVRTGCAVAVSFLPEDAACEKLVVLVEARRDTETEVFGEVAASCTTAILAATGLEPSQVVVLEPGTLPRTSSGKKRRQEALRQLLAGELGPPTPVSALRLAGAVARSAMAYARMSWGKRATK